MKQASLSSAGEDEETRQASSVFQYRVFASTGNSIIGSVRSRTLPCRSKPANCSQSASVGQDRSIRGFVALAGALAAQRGLVHDARGEQRGWYRKIRTTSTRRRRAWRVRTRRGEGALQESEFLARSYCRGFYWSGDGSPARAPQKAHGRAVVRITSRMGK
jgi:hypothetical protein